MSDTVHPRPLAVTVSVLTYRRLPHIRALLPQLMEQAESLAMLGAEVQVVVVDNDPAGGAGPVVQRIAKCTADSTVGLVYRHEPKPGIAQARNSALDAATSSDLLAFIDDDERPSESWLTSLVETWTAYGCAAVLGPVVPVFESDPDPWIVAGGFFKRPRWPTGTLRTVGATSNLLLDMTVVRDLQLRFDVALGLTGGEDTLFTASISKAGHTLVWCDEAEVYDLVPASRLDHGWVLRRRFRFGTTRSLVALRLESSRPRRGLLRAWLSAQGLVRVGAGAAQALVGSLAKSDAKRALGARTLAQGTGLLVGAWGRDFEEYAR